MKRLTLRHFGLGFFSGMGLFVIAVVARVAFAADAPLPNQDYVNMALDMLAKLPYVGAGLAIAVKWVGLVAGLMTVLSAFVSGLAKSFRGAALFLGFDDLADSISAKMDSVLYYLKYLSAYNVQKGGQAAAAPAPAPSDPSKPAA